MSRSLRAAVAHHARRTAVRSGYARDALLDRLGAGPDRYVPAHHDEAEGYTERFPDSARAFRSFLRRSRHICNGDGPGTAVVVMPWFGTPSPWSAVATGLAFARRGHRVTFVVHDLPLPGPKDLVLAEIAALDDALDLVRSRFPVVRVSDAEPGPEPSPTETEAIDHLVAQILTWFSRADVHPENHELHRSRRTRDLLRDALPRVRTVVAGLDAELLVVSGGVLQASGLYLMTAPTYGIRAATFDAGLGWTVVGTAGVAAQQHDVSRAVRMLEREAGPGLDALVASARQALAERRTGTDAMGYQTSAPTGSPAVDAGSGPVLIPLSVMFDTAALGRSHLYPDIGTWLVETVRTILDGSEAPVVVRRHPSERHVGERGRFDPAAVLRTALGPQPRVEVVEPEDGRNTYDLLDAARLVVPFVSTIGIEAAALGHPVVLGGDAYYADLGFTWSPRTRAEYEELVRRGARGDLGPATTDPTRAWLCYYLNAVTARTWTDFTPQPPDFWRWVRRDPDEVLAEPAVDDLVTALADDVPLSLIRHRRRTAEGRD